MQSLAIVQSNPIRVVAEQSFTPDEGSSFLWFLLFFLACYCAWKRRWLVAVTIGLFSLVMLGRPPKQNPSMRMILDKAHGDITWQSFSGDRVLSSSTARAESYISADLDSHLADKRIVLTKQDGEQTFPLGTAFESNESLQYVLVEDLRRMIEITRPLSHAMPSTR